MSEARVMRFNVVCLGLVFLLVFSGFNTLVGIQHLILNSAKDPASGGYVVGFYGDGFWSLATIFMVQTAANWIAPSVIALVGPRLVMFVSAITYVLFKAQLLVLNTELLYASSVLVGVGAGLMWTTQGHFLAINSDDKTITQNSGIFWAMLMGSGLIGHAFVYFQFKGSDDIDSETRTVVVTALLGMTIAGTLAVALLRPTPWVQNNTKESPIQALKNSFTLFCNRDMLMLSFSLFYTGINLNICFAMVGTCVGFTYAFGTERKALTNLVGMFMFGGEILGGVILTLFGGRLTKYGRIPIVVLGFFLSMTAYLLTLLNLPNECPLRETEPHETAIIESNRYLAIFTSFLLGVSDSCINTQSYSIIGTVFKDSSAPAFAIFKFLQSLASSIAFWYSPVLKLYWQLLIAALCNVCSLIGFCSVEWRRKRSLGEQERDSCHTSAGNKNNGYINEECF